MVNLASCFHNLNPKRILVAGDFILDRYTFGACRRISPEAPVPVVSVSHEEERAGGAGNVILNLISLGMQARVFGRVGADAAGELLIQNLANQGADTSCLYKERGFQTPVKVRLIANSQQLLRVDYEKPQATNLRVEAAEIRNMLEGVDLVAISDYAKGFLTPQILRCLIDEANKQKIPVLTDPKGTQLTKYAGSTILKPNLSEAYAAAPDKTTLKDVADEILKTAKVETLMITRSEAGISLFYPNGVQEDYPVLPREVKDVTGAGDTVLATLAAAVANKIPLAEATQLANVAAQVAVERVGCACVSLADIAHALFEEASHQSKIFGDIHLPLLQEALKAQKFDLITIDAKSELNRALISSIRSKKGTKKLVVGICGTSDDLELASLVASLKDVGHVLVTSKDANSLTNQLTF